MEAKGRVDENGEPIYTKRDELEKKAFKELTEWANKKLDEGQHAMPAMTGKQAQTEILDKKWVEERLDEAVSALTGNYEFKLQCLTVSKLEYFAARAPAAPEWYEAWKNSSGEKSKDPNDTEFSWPWYFAKMVLEAKPK